MLGASGYLVAGITFWAALCKWLCGLLSRAAPTWRVLCGWQAAGVWLPVYPATSSSVRVSLCPGPDEEAVWGHSKADMGRK